MPQKQLRITVLLLIAAFALVTARLIWVNLYQGMDFVALAQNQRLTGTPEYEYARGDFLDRHGTPLTGRAERVLLAFPAQLADNADNSCETFLRCLLARHHITPCADFPAALSGTRPFMVARSLSAAQMQAISAEINGHSGLFCTIYHPRYAANSPAAHLIGYVSHDGVGQTGLESQYDSILAGRTCRRLAIACDEQGRQTGNTLRAIESNEVNHAQNVRLTLDFSYQQILDAAMADKNGAAVLMDVKTGDVLALTSSPAFNQSVGQPATDGDSYTNKATAYFPPASVFKLVLATAALENGISLDENTFTCTGEVTLSTGQIVHCWHTNGHGAEDMATALANSCNPYFITLGQKLGGSLISEYAWRLGMTEQVLLGFAVNSQNMLDFNPNVPADIANVSIGEKGIRATPLMVARLLAAIANDGLLPTPRLVIGTEYESGTTTGNVQAATPRRVISSKTARTLRQMLIGAVTDGTGTPVASPIISIAGKTGTTQNFGVWFAGFFPADSPRWSMAVYIADGNSGGRDAGAVCREVAEKLALLEGIAATGAV